MKIVDLGKHGFAYAYDCAFTDRNLYVAEHTGKKCTYCQQLENSFDPSLL